MAKAIMPGHKKREAINGILKRCWFREDCDMVRCLRVFIIKTAKNQMVRSKLLHRIIRNYVEQLKKAFILFAKKTLRRFFVVRDGQCSKIRPVKHVCSGRVLPVTMLCNGSFSI
jgi:hypothetical protein